MEKEKFETFKEVLKTLAVDNYRACKSFTEKIDKCKDLDDIDELLCYFCDEIHEKLGGDTTDYEYEIEELNDTIYQLECEVEELRPNIVTMHDDMKYKVFLEHHNNFDPWEFEELLTNKK